MTTDHFERKKENLAKVIISIPAKSQGWVNSTGVHKKNWLLVLIMDKEVLLFSQIPQIGVCKLDQYEFNDRYLPSCE